MNETSLRLGGEEMRGGQLLRYRLYYQRLNLLSTVPMTRVNSVLRQIPSRLSNHKNSYIQWNLLASSKLLQECTPWILYLKLLWKVEVTHFQQFVHYNGSGDYKMVELGRVDRNRRCLISTVGSTRSGNKQVGVRWRNRKGVSAMKGRLFRFLVWFVSITHVQAWVIGMIVQGRTISVWKVWTGEGMVSACEFNITGDTYHRVFLSLSWRLSRCSTRVNS